MMTISDIIEIIVVCALIFFPLGYLARHSLRRIRDTLRLFFAKEGANKRGNSSRLTQSFHFFMFEPIFSPVNALNQPI